MSLDESYNKERIMVGKYSFDVVENQRKYNGKLFMRTFKIGGDYQDCVNLSYTYNNGNPVSAKLPHLMYEPECSIGSDHPRGLGSVVLIKSLLEYAHNKIKDVSKFEFDDMSNIDCVEKDLSLKPPRLLIKPLKLSYFSLAYHDKTWYEKNFNATMKDKQKYKKYRETITFLKDPNRKESFETFLAIAKPPIEQINLLKSYYENANTYREFFNNIPFDNRCDILFPWLVGFMSYYLKDIIIEYGWEIDINTMNNTNKINTKKGGNRKNKTIKENRLVPKKYKLINYTEMHSF